MSALFISHSSADNAAAEDLMADVCARLPAIEECSTSQ